MVTTKPTKQETIEFEVVEDEESESHASSNAKWGQVFSTYRSFYLCRAGGANPCYTVMPSDAWRAKHNDPWARKQKYYCNCCNACYKTTFGMIIEIEFDGQFYYVKTYIPPDNFEAMRAKHFEQPPTSREDLLHKLKNVTPHTSRILLPVTIKDVYEGNKFDDTFKITAVSYKQLEDFDWEEILDFAQDVTAV
jgi:hypothetical protein